MKEVIKVVSCKELKGEVSIAGSKNSALACLAAASITPDENPIVLKNIPDISDIQTMIDILRSLGKKVIFENGILSMSGEINNSVVLPEKSKKLRGSMYFLGILAATTGEIYCGIPGGDKIGKRPIDIHIHGLRKLGVNFTSENGEIIVGKAEKGLEGCTIYLKYPSVGATCNLMLAATKATGRTVLTNVAKEPEIVDMANLLSKMGARITGAGTDKITISGVDELHGGVEHEVISDRIESGTLASIVAVCGGDVLLKHAIPYHNFPIISLLEDIGVKIEASDESLRIISDRNLKPVEVEMMPFPGIATDLQSSIALMATQAKGDSTIVDLVFQKRFQYVDELNKMGALMQLSENNLIIHGGKKLRGCHVFGNDIRAVSTLIGAGLIAEGETIIDGVIHLKRGYPDFDKKIRKLGGSVEIVAMDI